MANSYAHIACITGWVPAMLSAALNTAEHIEDFANIINTIELEVGDSVGTDGMLLSDKNDGTDKEYRFFNDYEASFHARLVDIINRGDVDALNHLRVCYCMEDKGVYLVTNHTLLETVRCYGEDAKVGIENFCPYFDEEFFKKFEVE